MDHLIVVDQLMNAAARPSRNASVPNTHGFYAWWIADSSRQYARPVIPHVPKANEPSLSLLYVGISPNGLKSAKNGRCLPDRIQKDHRNNIRGSTFRFSMTVLLRDHLKLAPLCGYDRARIKEEGTLSKWLDEFCQLTIVTCPDPWETEEQVIREMRPPLNIRGGVHPFRNVVSDLRRSLEKDCGLVD